MRTGSHRPNNAGTKLLAPVFDVVDALTNELLAPRLMTVSAGFLLPPEDRAPETRRG
jgi:hypothetical protein